MADTLQAADIKTADPVVGQEPARDSPNDAAANPEPVTKAEPKSVIGEVKDAVDAGEPKKDSTAPFDAKALKLPEGFSVDDATVKQLTDAIPGIQNDQAQKLVDIHTAALKAAAQGPIDFWTKQQDEWVKDIARNPEFGSGNPENPLKPEVSAAVAKVMDQFGGAPLRDAFTMTGAGNNPTIVAAMVKISKILTEGGHVAGMPAKGPPSVEQSFGFNYQLGGVPKP